MYVIFLLAYFGSHGMSDGLIRKRAQMRAQGTEGTRYEAFAQQEFFPVMLGLLIVTTPGCGNDGSSGISGDIWFDAGPVQQMYAAQIRMEAVEAGRSEVDRSCKKILPLAEESLRDSGNGTVVQIMYKLCSNAGLRFQNEIRCQADRLQLLCR